MHHDELLFVGTHGHVLALNKANGREVWATSLPKTGYSLVSILVDDGVLFCASGGRTFALDISNGEVLWTNQLKGKGSGLVYLASINQASTETPFASEAEAAKRRAAAARAAS